jgi:curved DNA-binding protein CbpA
MNYYEELALTESASAEKIRQAYKSLARLLRPDHQCDHQVRKLAELQMMRLNEIVAELTDVRRREKYDASIHPALATTGSLAADAPAWIRAGTVAGGASLALAAVGFSLALLDFAHGSAVPGHAANVVPPTLPSREVVPAASPIQARGARPGSQPRTKRTVQAARSSRPWLRSGRSQDRIRHGLSN